MKLWLFLFLFLLTSKVATGQKALSQVQLDSVEFSEAGLPIILDFLSLKAKEMNGQPSNFVLYDPSGKLKEENPVVTLNLTNVPFSTVFKYVTQLSNTGFLIDRRVVWIGKPDDLEVLKQRRATRTSKILASPAFQRLARTRVADIDFTGTTLTEAVEGIRQLDRAKNGPGNFVVIPGESNDPATIEVTMKLAGISLAELTHFTSELSGFQLRVDSRAIVLRAPDSREIPSPPTSNRFYQYLGNRTVKKVSLFEVTIPEAIEFIQYHSKSPSLPGGINIVQLSKSDKTVTLDLQDIRVIDLLRYVNEQTETTIRADGSAIQIVDLPPLKRKEE